MYVCIAWSAGTEAAQRIGRLADLWELDARATNFGRGASNAKASVSTRTIFSTVLQGFVERLLVVAGVSVPWRTGGAQPYRNGRLAG